MDNIVKRILIVDDNTSIHEDFKKILVQNKSMDGALDVLEQQIFGVSIATQDETSLPMPIYELTFCTQGLEAIATVDAAEKEEKPFSLIFMDVRMPPGIDGIETTKRIRERHPEIQVVICSAYSDYSWSEMIDKLSVTDSLLFLKKPFERIEVLQMALALTTKWQLAKDLTAHINNLEKMVEDRTRELEMSRAKSIEASKFAALGVMSAGLCHEINSPLATIMILAEQLKESLLAGDSEVPHHEVADTIFQTGERISRIIKGLKIFSRTDDFESFRSSSLSEIIDDTLVFCRSRFNGCGVKLDISVNPKSLMVECQPVKMSQVLLNLLNNAIDAVEDQSEKWVKVEVKEAGPLVELSVSDSGPGVAPEVAEKIMQPFFTTKPVGKGTGLGLSITKGIIEGHGGTFVLDKVSANTKFVIRIPKTQTSSRVA